MNRLLRRRGVRALLVCDGSREPHTLVVYLDGNAGRVQQQETRAFVTRLPGVQAVEVSEQSWTILRVRLASSRPARNG